MKRCASQVLITLILAVSIFSQSEDQKPILFDEFGVFPLGDLSARTDALRHELMTRKEASALIRIYGGTENSLAFPYIRKAFYEAYFSNFPDVGKNRITIQVCKSNESRIRNQFFVVPKGVVIDKCEDAFKVPLETTLIGTEIFNPVGNADDYLGTKGVDAAIDEAFYDFIAELLKKSFDSRIHIIGYAGRYFDQSRDCSGKEIVSEIDSLKVNDKSLKRIKNSITKRGVDASRIVTLKGGYRNDSREAEIWFVPKDGEIPKPKPNYFPKQKRKANSWLNQ